MKKLLILAILFCTPVFACDSYEECMSKRFMKDGGGNAAMLQAIAYKLDEISHKINKITLEVVIRDERGVQVTQKTTKTKEEYDCETSAGFMEYDSTTGVGHCIHAV